MLNFPFLKKLKRRKIQFAFKEDIEPHEILLDSLARKKEKEFGLSEKKFEIPLLRKIIQGFFLFCFLLVCFLFFKTFQLQIIKGKEYTQLAERNKFVLRQLEAERGVIYDQKMEQLAFNKTTFDLFCQGEFVKSLSHEDLISYQGNMEEYPDCQIVNNSVREYKDSQVFAHILGYLGKIKKEELAEDYSLSDYIGRSGLENYYEKYLRKSPGKVKVERDAYGDKISEEIVSLPQSGESLVLWIDADLQRKMSEELEKKYQELGAKGAVAIAMNPKTGAVLSLISLPSFDNNLFQKGADSVSLQSLLDDHVTYPLFNRAISGKYLTGSTIKPLIALAALEEGIITPEKQIYSPGYIAIPHQYNPEIVYRFGDWTTHGWVDLRKALAQSCNVYFYAVGGGYEDQKGLGPGKIKEYLDLFGWEEKVGIDIPGEVAGFVPDPEWKRNSFSEGWWDGNTYYLSIGQEYLQITPLEVVSAFSAIANGGKLMEPRIVKEIIDSDKNVIQEFDPLVLRENFIDSDNLQIVREGMRQAVTGINSPQASATILNSLTVTSAAKTGTAELGNDRYHNWVTLFAPYDDPEIVLTIMIENVEGVQAAVLPIARDILEWYFSR